MITKEIENMDLYQIAESGQCFRWTRLDEPIPAYAIVAGSQYVEVRQINSKISLKDGRNTSTFTFSCSEPYYRGFWCNYFDLYRDYYLYRQDIYVRGADDLLIDAMAAGEGIRILNQNAWEMLITFLTAQNITIDRVKALLDKLCLRYGEPLIDHKTQKPYNAFPTPDKLAKATPEELRGMGFGYRDKQIISAAKICNTAAFDINELWREDYSTCKLVLKNILGVGDKVADCISLFGLGKWESYPIDTWVKKIETHYGEGYIQRTHQNTAGLVQQYLFAYARENGLPENEA